MCVNCKQCGGAVGGSATGSRCRCGWRLDDGCRDGHEEWCPADGPDAWLGAQEL